MKSDDKSSPGFVKGKYYLPFLSALLLSASIIPYHLLITNFIFLVPLLFFIKDLKSGKDSLKGGILFGATLYLTIFYWFYALLRISFFLAIFLYLATIVFFSIAITMLVLISYFIYRRWKIKFFLFMPFLWIVIEHLKTLGPFRSTGDHIANSMAIFPQLIQFIDITGPYGITFWLLLVNALIFEAIVSYRKKIGWIKYAAIAALIAILPASYSLFKWKTLAYMPDLRMSMLQPDIPLKKKLTRGYEAENMNVVLSMTSEAIKQKPDIIIWPETSFPFPLVHWIDKADEPSLPEISNLSRRSKIPILVGAEYARIKSKEDYDIYNAALLIDSSGNVQNYYGKIYLVPFTEAIPFKEILGMKRLGKKGFLARLGAFTSGEKFTLFEMERKASQRNESEGTQASEEESTTRKLWKGKNKTGEEWVEEKTEKHLKFGVLICYEGLYPEIARQFRKEGADFLVCITNDAWFGNTWFPYWHASVLKMRAIENRTSIARCGNTGVSCFFDPAGRVYQNTEIFTKGIITGSIATPSSSTIYTRYGDVIVYISYPVVLILIFLTAFFRKKDK